MNQEQQKSPVSTQASSHRGQLSEELRLKKMLLDYSRLIKEPLTQEMAEYHLAGEAGWEEYEGPIPEWVNDLPMA